MEEVGPEDHAVRTARRRATVPLAPRRSDSLPRLLAGTRPPRPAALSRPHWGEAGEAVSSGTPSPHHRETAGDTQDLASHVGCLVGGEVGHRARHVFGLAETPQRDAATHALEDLGAA